MVELQQLHLYIWHRVYASRMGSGRVRSIELYDWGMVWCELRIAIYAEDSQGNDDGEIVGLKLDKYYNASNSDP